MQSNHESGHMGHMRRAARHSTCSAVCISRSRATKGSSMSKVALCTACLSWLISFQYTD